ncbi:MAG: SAM-dependent methyltransferase, partial [Pseudomonadota bacterium]
VGQLIQCRRALAPDGLFLGVAFGGQTLHELRAVLAQAETAVMGGLSPRVAPMADIRDMGALLQRAGLALPVADSLPRRVRYTTMFRLMADLRAMGETNALAARHRRFAPKHLFAEAARIYQEHFADADGIGATYELLFLSGWAPAETQQKPLRPGSATTRLADVLGVKEQGA